MNRVVNTRQSMVSQLQMPTMSRQGVPVSFVNMDDEPPEPDKDAPAPAPPMPDQPPAHLDPTPDEPNEDEDEREHATPDPTPQECARRDRLIAAAMAKIREGYIDLSRLLAEK